MRRTKRYILRVIPILLCCSEGFSMPPGYKGEPFKDKNHQSGAQVIPGVVETALYDLGGEGVAYHDSDPQNEGAKINHGESKTKEGVVWKRCRPGTPEYICFFRENEAVDLSYLRDITDFSHTKNLFVPAKDQQYLGWQEDGEWTNYTVNVKAAGTYTIKALYSNKNLVVNFSLDGKPAAACKLPVDTGSMHHWNKADCGEITFPKAGLQLLTIYEKTGINLASFEFVRKSAK